jgi:hypothetical protein
MPAAGAATACTGTIANTTVNDNVVVPAGATCVLLNTTVTKNVAVEPGASITIVGTTIQGSLASSGAHDVRIGDCGEFGCPNPRRTVINGNVAIQGTTGVPFFPTKNVICDATFAGANVVIQGNSAPFTIGTDPECNFGTVNQIAGSLVVVGNTAPMTLRNNAVGGTLQCAGNSPAPVNGGGNTAAGGKLGQCAGF